MKRVLISGYLGFENFGDEVLLYTLIRDLLRTGYKIQDISVISNNPRKTTASYRMFSIDRWNFLDVINGILRTEAIIFIGGLFQDKTSFKSFLYYFFQLFLGNLFRKEIVLYGAGIGPFEKTITESLFNFGIRDVRFITVRDQESQNFLPNKKNAQVTIDPAWSIMPDFTFQKKIPNINWQLPIVGVSIRNDKHLKQKHLDELAEKLSRILTGMKDWQILLLPCMLQEDLPFLTELYDLITRKMTAQSRVFVLETFNRFPISQQAGILASCDAMIGMRYHALLIPLANGKPVFGLIFDQKVKSLLDFSEQTGSSFKDDMNQPWNYFWQNLQYSSEAAKQTRQKALQLHRKNIELLRTLYNT